MDRRLWWVLGGESWSLESPVDQATVKPWLLRGKKKIFVRRESDMIESRILLVSFIKCN